jgi:hypothetical protein
MEIGWLRQQRIPEEIDWLIIVGNAMVGNGMRSTMVIKIFLYVILSIHYLIRE